MAKKLTLTNSSSLSREVELIKSITCVGTAVALHMKQEKQMKTYKKYSNRKLYDCEESKYVTLKDWSRR